MTFKKFFKTILIVMTPAIVINFFQSNHSSNHPSIYSSNDEIKKFDMALESTIPEKLHGKELIYSYKSVLLDESDAWLEFKNKELKFFYDSKQNNGEPIYFDREEMSFIKEIKFESRHQFHNDKQSLLFATIFRQLEGFIKKKYDKSTNRSLKKYNNEHCSQGSCISKIEFFYKFSHDLIFKEIQDFEKNKHIMEYINFEDSEVLKATAILFVE